MLECVEEGAFSEDEHPLKFDEVRYALATPSNSKDTTHGDVPFFGKVVHCFSY